ncbi:2-C-methyl-D-erythritol 4-phosphate cytidylyltransferase [Sulfuriferula plumbiphila]|nr:2-C-methyl-D-erythritol 4-phosphate cytidylyltransferase [Sulfuriferula plumbiphila]
MADHYALIPAAGNGSRMGGKRPKQYLDLAGKPMIYHALRRLAGSPRIRRVYVVISPADAYWDDYDWREFASKLSVLRCGGSIRADSVRNGLVAMASEVAENDWVLVHDAARPCLSAAQLDRLLDEAGSDPVGGLLAMPVADTLKRADTSRHVCTTEPREGLWQAQTPQMFRHVMLLHALHQMRDTVPTDEARAIEALGHRPLLVAADNSNFKVTYPRDLYLARLILENPDD